MSAKRIELLHRDTVFSGFSRLHVIRLRHRRHDGSWSGVLEREVFERGDAVTVLPYDPVRDQVVLLEQFRPGAFLAGQPCFQLEPVAGMIEPAETPTEVARREAREEAGLDLLGLERIGTYLVSPGCATEAVHAWCGKVDAGAAGGLHGNSAEDEDIRVHVLDYAEVLERHAAGAFGYAITLITLQWLMLNRDRLRRLWAA